jgi:hypothetical protein
LWGVIVIAIVIAIATAIAIAIAIIICISCFRGVRIVTVWEIFRSTIPRVVPAFVRDSQEHLHLARETLVLPIIISLTDNLTCYERAVLIGIPDGLASPVLTYLFCTVACSDVRRTPAISEPMASSYFTVSMTARCFCFYYLFN